MMFLCSVLLLLLLAQESAFGWESCSEDQGAGLCPDGNTCCYTGSRGVSSCISGKEPGLGSCCVDDGAGLSGCGDGYDCAFEEQLGFYCQRVVEDRSEPERLHRYRLCHLPTSSLKQVYGLEVAKATPRLAYYSTMHSLDDFHADVTTALIIIHGSGRNADDYLCCGASSTPENSNIMVIAPRFLIPGDTTPTTGNWLRWHEKGPIPHTWRYGADAINAPISSYETVDALVERLVFDTGRFGSLRRIIVAGHSAGGQLAQRWALTSSSPAWNNKKGRLGAPNVSIRVVVANPRSFCYLDERRFIDGKFQTPNSTMIAACPGYNKWEWGLEQGGPLEVPYVDRAVQKIGGPSKLSDRYTERDIVYLAGELDILPQHDECVTADFQGPNRFTRSQHFFSSLEELYHRRVHSRLVATMVPHDHCLMFQSPAGQEALFGDPADGREEESVMMG